MFYLSAYLEEHREEYIERLRAIGQQPDAWNQWIAFFLEALDQQARANAEKARAIMDLYARLKDRLIGLTRSQFAVPLLDQIFERPLFHRANLKFPEEHSPSRQAIAVLLRTLRDDGILSIVRQGRGRRPQLMAFVELINLCEGKEVL